MASELLVGLMANMEAQSGTKSPTDADVEPESVHSLPNSIPSAERPPRPKSGHLNNRGHVLPRNPVIDINKPGRYRTCHVLAVCSFSHSTLYSRLKDGTFPEPDGKDGGLNFWNTSTIKKYLETGSGSESNLQVTAGPQSSTVTEDQSCET
jgi:predicted DNA-binding transcriptional regulator AlpA